MLSCCLVLRPPPPIFFFAGDGTYPRACGDILQLFYGLYYTLKTNYLEHGSARSKKTRHLLRLFKQDAGVDRGLDEWVQGAWACATTEAVGIGYTPREHVGVDTRFGVSGLGRLAQDVGDREESKGSKETYHTRSLSTL